MCTHAGEAAHICRIGSHRAYIDVVGRWKTEARVFNVEKLKLKLAEKRAQTTQTHVI
jgi:hypothetical protein